MSPHPAASRRFIAYSGEVCRKPRRPFTRASTLARCTSVTEAAARFGVSTSSARVAAKYSRAARSIEARISSVAIDAVGCQSETLKFDPALFPSGARATWRSAGARNDAAEPHCRSGRRRSLPRDAIALEQEHHGRAHVETP